jgi:hypothetical protein
MPIPSPTHGARHSIKTIEWLTGKLTVFAGCVSSNVWVRSPDRISGRDDAGHGHRPETPQHQLDRIPDSGPVVWWPTTRTVWSTA